MSSHPKHDMHANSLASHDQLDEINKIEQVYLLYAQMTVPHTDRQVMREMGYTDMNEVRPIITKLIQEGRLRECGEMIDEETNRTVRLVTTIGLTEKPVRKLSSTEKLIADLQAKVEELERSNMKLRDALGYYTTVGIAADGGHVAKIALAIFGSAPPVTA